MHHSARTRTALAAIALLLVPAVAACGSTDSKDAGLPAAQGQKSTNKKADATKTADAQAKYDECMTQHGAPMKDGAATGPSDYDVAMAAEAACKELAKDLPVQQAAPDADEKILKTQLKLAKCLRGAGYDYPDPDPNGGSQSQFQLKPGQSAEQFQQDQAKCAEEAGLGAGMVTSSSGGQ